MDLILVIVGRCVIVIALASGDIGMQATMVYAVWVRQLSGQTSIFLRWCCCEAPLKDIPWGLRGADVHVLVERLWSITNDLSSMLPLSNAAASCYTVLIAMYTSVGMPISST